MKNKLLLRLFILAFILTQALLANALTPIKVKRNFRKIDVLQEHAQMQINKNWPDSASWKNIDGNTVLRIPIDSTGWLRLFIQNEDTVDISIDFYFQSVSLSRSKIYVINGEAIDFTQPTGNLIPFFERATQKRDMSLRYTFKAGQTTEIYISIHRRGFSQIVNLNVADSLYGDGTHWVDHLIIIILSFSLLIFIMALSAAFSLGRFEYSYYVMYVGGGALYLTASYGYLAYFLPEAIWLIETGPVIFGAIALTGFVLFATHFLNIEQWHRNTSLVLKASPAIGMILVFSAIAFTDDKISHILYRSIIAFAGIWGSAALIIIMWVVQWRVRQKKEKDYIWFLGIFINLFVLVLISLAFETRYFYIGQGREIIVELILVSLEVLITLSFLIFYTYRRFEDQKLVALQVEKEKDQQRQDFSNMLHTNIKGGLNSVLQDVKDEGRGLITAQLKNLIEECELGEVFLQEGHKNLHALLTALEFWARPILHHEVQERYFYAEIDPALKTFKLTHNELLNIFLHEAVTNLKRYSKYRYARLIAKMNRHESQEKVSIAVIDDGIGLQQTLGIPQNPLTITGHNFQEISQKYFKSQSTGIRRLFKLVEAENQAELVIHSEQAAGTSFTLIFRIQDSLSGEKH